MSTFLPLLANLKITDITHSHSISNNNFFLLKRAKRKGFNKKAFQLNNFKTIFVNEDINLKNQLVFDYIDGKQNNITNAYKHHN